MMGYKIAFTGLVVFFVFAFMAHVSKQPPKSDKLFIFFGVIMLAGMFAVPAGIIVQIWI